MMGKSVSGGGYCRRLPPIRGGQETISAYTSITSFSFPAEISSTFFMNLSVAF